MMREYGIYVHIPFCKSKCKYCDFNSFCNKDEYIEKYIQKLIYEIQKCEYFSNDDVCSTIYIGGGTPSYIYCKYISQILQEIYKRFNVDINAEITIEVNPSSITTEKLMEYKENRVNRISIGLQETNNDILKTIGRIHTYETFLEKYELIKLAGFKNINVDLMIGLPNQIIHDVENTIEKIINLSPNHISCYSLILYENSLLYKEIQQNRYNMPNDELERKVYYTVCEKLKEAGYNQYEISNFSKKGFESKHNMNCWQQYEYVGFGAGAHSFVNNKRFSNIEDIQKYIENDYNENIVIHEQLDNIGLMKEYMMLGFRMINGIYISNFSEKFGKSVYTVFDKEIKELINKGLLEIINDKDGICIRPTSKGIDFNNIICEKFV